MIEPRDLSEPVGYEALLGSSLERLYKLLREAHDEMERTAHTLQLREADLLAARKELEKAIHLRDRVKDRAADIEAAIIDRRRAERGIGALASPPIPVDPQTGAPRP